MGCGNSQPNAREMERDTGTARPDPTPGGDVTEPDDLEEGVFDEEDVPPFHVVDVNLQVKSNRFLHKTDKYEHTELLVRRGQTFQLDIKVDKPFVKGKDDIKLQFESGNNPLRSKGTMFLITPGKSLDLKQASAVIDNISQDDGGSTIRLNANFPSDSVIGRFTLYVRVRNKEDAGNDRKFVKHKVDQTLIVLYNPWCKTDTVYLDDDKERAEYVLSDKGLVYVGKSTRNRGRKWNFGQFDKDSLDAVLHLLDESSLPTEGYGNPVVVSRTLSALVNSNDSSGVLTGNWTGNYTSGTAPTEWNGSVRILEEYMRTKSAVKFGQCWVFSCVLTTVSRALGLPTRSVTNFNSAHDSDLSMTIDYHHDTDGKPLKHMNDSVWNFHVWNECWMKRPDLPSGNDGWQAFDATPQERSDGQMQCGPAPVKAIKEGNVHLDYDTKFVFGEVNGDKVTWQVDGESGEKKVTKVNKATVGKNISTKSVGKPEQNYVTDHYKYKEGSDKERSVVKKVVQHSSRREALEAFYKLDHAHDVDMAFTGNMADNADASFVFKVKNTSGEKRTVNAHITLMAKYYTGKEGNDIDEQKKAFTLDPGQDEEFSWTLRAADWLNKIDEDATIGAFVHAKVEETSQVFTEEESYEIEKPELQLKLSKTSVNVWEEVEVEITFKNPLDIPITNASFLVEGAGIKNEQKITISSDIPARDTVSRSVKLTPKMSGQREILASFHSRQLVNIYGSAELDVKEEQ